MSFLDTPGIFDIKWNRPPCEEGAGAAHKGGDARHVLGHAAADGCLYTYSLVRGDGEGEEKTKRGVGGAGGTTGAGNDLRLQQLGSVSCAESVGSLALSLDWSLHPTAASSSQVSHAQSRRAAELTAVLSSAAFCA